MHRVSMTVNVREFWCYTLNMQLTTHRNHATFNKFKAFTRVLLMTQRQWQCELLLCNRTRTVPLLTLCYF